MDNFLQSQTSYGIKLIPHPLNFFSECKTFTLLPINDTNVWMICILRRFIAQFYVFIYCITTIIYDECLFTPLGLCKWKTLMTWRNRRLNHITIVLVCLDFSIPLMDERDHGFPVKYQHGLPVNCQHGLPVKWHGLPVNCQHGLSVKCHGLPVKCQRKFRHPTWVMRSKFSILFIRYLL